MLTLRTRMTLTRIGHLIAGVLGLPISHSWQRAADDRRARKLQPSKGSEAGFTLVEVIVALAMLSIGLGLVLGLISDGLKRTGSAGRMAEAGSLAQSLMAQVGTDWSIKPDERDGLFPNGFRWRLRMLPYGDVKEREEWPVGVYTISTEVEWEEGTGLRSYALTTLRLGPKAVRQ